MIVSNKDMVAVDVKAARTENCKDGSNSSGFMPVDKFVNNYKI